MDVACNLLALQHGREHLFKIDAGAVLYSLGPVPPQVFIAHADAYDPPSAQRASAFPGNIQPSARLMPDGEGHSNFEDSVADVAQPERQTTTFFIVLDPWPSRSKTLRAERATTVALDNCDLSVGCFSVLGDSQSSCFDATSIVHVEQQYKPCLLRWRELALVGHADLPRRLLRWERLRLLADGKSWEVGNARPALVT